MNCKQESDLFHRRVFLYLLWIWIVCVNPPWEEIAFNTIRVADTYLYMVLLCEASTGIKRFTFPKDAADRIVCMLIGILVNLVCRLDDSAIKFTNQFIRRCSNICILWKWLSCRQPAPYLRRTCHIRGNL